MKHLASVFDSILIRFLAVAAVIPLLVSNAMAAYTLTDLGEFGKRSQYNVSINNAGQVVGCVYTPDGGHHAAIWSYGVITDLGTLGGKWSYANGINEAGQVVGVSHIEGDLYFHAFLWSNGTMQDLGAGGGNYGYAHVINDQGVVGGTFGELQEPAIWVNGTLTYLGFQQNGYISSMNNSLQMVGFCGYDNAWLWSNGAAQSLGNLLGGTGRFASGINEAGQIIGSCEIPGGPYHAFLMTNGTVIDLDPGGMGTNGWASNTFDINNLGDVVGYAKTAQGVEHAFLWSNGIAIDLNDEIVGTGWTLQRAIGINDRGQIVGYGIDGSGQERTFLLTPPNIPPVPNAGENLTMTSSQVATTIIHGTAKDQDAGDVLTYCWMEGQSVLLDWTAVGAGGDCPLNLGSVPLSIGSHTLVLKVRDGKAMTSDDMILTIGNSAPHAVASGGGSYPLGTDVSLTGQVSDFDGDLLSYSWREGTNVLCSGTVTAPAGGAVVNIPEACIAAGLGLGSHTFVLEVSDAVNPPVVRTVVVNVVDGIEPKLSPVADRSILWPPNHKMVEVTIMANASDNSGLPVTLTASVSSNEPVNGTGDGNTAPDWTEPVIDQNTGKITLLLRSERSGKGNGRVYSVMITATDTSGNSTTAVVQIIVPHDQAAQPILWRNSFTGANVVWYMNGATFLSAEQLPTVTDQDWKIVGMADFDNDGQSDILWSHKSGANVVWHMNGASYRYASYLLTVADTNWEAMGVADFNDDGNPDILWRNHANGSTAVWYMNGANFQGAEQLPTVTDTNWEIVGIADFDLDGHLDILWRNAFTGASAVWHLRGANFQYASHLLAVTDLNWQMAGTADFDDDNHPDLIWRNTATGATVVWYMDGANFRYAAQLPTVTDTNWEIVGP